MLAAGILIQAGPAAGQTLVSRIEAESRWETIDVVEFGAMDLDVSRVTVTAPGIYEVRTRWRFATAQTTPEGQRYQSSVAVRGVDCRRGEMALIAFANHDGGTVVNEESLPVYAARWEPVAPGSVVGRVASRVCEGGPSAPIAASTAR
jgi:hypothetical protein